MVGQMVILMVVAMVLQMVLLMGSEAYVNITIFELGLYHCFDITSFKQVLTGVTAETYF